MEKIFKVRFNTDFPLKSKYIWRVIEVKERQWMELFTQHITINVFSETTTDELADGRIRHHITMKPYRVFFGQQNEDGGFEHIAFY
jgi:hypothetical protein